MTNYEDYDTQEMSPVFRKHRIIVGGRVASRSFQKNGSRSFDMPSRRMITQSTFHPSRVVKEVKEEEQD